MRRALLIAGATVGAFLVAAAAAAGAMAFTLRNIEHSQDGTD